MVVGKIASHLMFLVAASGVAQACSCLMRPPCEIFSKADDVVKALVVNIEENAPMKMQLTLKAATAFKGDIKRGQTFQVVTADHSAACGVTDLVKDKHALVTLFKDQKDGDSYRINICDYNRPWAHVSTEDRQELRRLKAEGPEYACDPSCKVGNTTVPAGWSGWGPDSNWCNRCRCAGKAGLMCTLKFCCPKDKCTEDPCLSAKPCLVENSDGKRDVVPCRTDFCTCKTLYTDENGMDVSDKCMKLS
eukprot:comp22956_c0_seq2/m.36440 comp22956_c0_seq2/g.36440  ORF comp22956_c0_seq2/g.36440 comp22956_c0_seq2/m.36440 type:complete len:248 (-) comp22956_c0_seq2:319-1062(-)